MSPPNSRASSQPPTEWTREETGQYEATIYSTAGLSWSPVVFSINTDIDYNLLENPYGAESHTFGNFIWGLDPDNFAKDWTGLIPGWPIPEPQNEKLKNSLGRGLYDTVLLNLVRQVVKPQNILNEYGGVSGVMWHAVYRGYVGVGHKPLVVETLRTKTMSRGIDKTMDTVTTIYPSKIP